MCIISNITKIQEFNYFSFPKKWLAHLGQSSIHVWSICPNYHINYMPRTSLNVEPWVEFCEDWLKNVRWWIHKEKSSLSKSYLVEKLWSSSWSLISYSKGKHLIQPKNITLHEQSYLGCNNLWATNVKMSHDSFTHFQLKKNWLLMVDRSADSCSLEADPQRGVGGEGGKGSDNPFWQQKCPKIDPNLLLDT